MCDFFVVVVEKLTSQGIPCILKEHFKKIFLYCFSLVYITETYGLKCLHV